MFRKKSRVDSVDSAKFGDTISGKSLDLRMRLLYRPRCRVDDRWLGASCARMNLAGTALQFFFHTTLGRSGFDDRMARIASPERLSVVL